MKRKIFGYGLALLVVAAGAVWLTGYGGVARYLLKWAIPAWLVVGVLLRGFDQD